MKYHRRPRRVYRLSVRLTRAEQERLNALCRATGLSLSDLGREAITALEKALQETEPCHRP